MKTINMTTAFRWIILLFVLFALWGPSAVWSSEADLKALQGSLDELGKDLEGISAQSMAILKSKEEAFYLKLEAYRDELDTRVDELETKLEKLSGESKAKTDQYIESMKAKNKELMEKVQTQLSEAKGEFEDELDQTMDGLQAKIKELRKETATMSDEAREKLEQRLKSLKKGNADIQRKLEDLKSKGTESWKDIKALVFDIWQELQKGFDKEMDLTQFQ